MPGNAPRFSSIAHRSFIHLNDARIRMLYISFLLDLHRRLSSCGIVKTVCVYGTFNNLLHNLSFQACRLLY